MLFKKKDDFGIIDKSREARRIQRITDRTDCSVAEAKKIIEERAASIPFNDFMKYELYSVKPYLQPETYLEKVKEAKLEKKMEREADMQRVIAATGWEREKVHANFKEARVRTGCMFKEYSRYRFFDIDETLQNELFLIHDSKMIREKFNTTPEIKRILMNKDLTNRQFEEYLKRPWTTNTAMTFREFCKIFKNTSKIIYKPNSGHRGFGVEAFELKEQNKWNVFDYLKDLPKGVVEGYVHQHREMNNLSPMSVNTIRIVSIFSDTQPVNTAGDSMAIAYAGLRIGSGYSIVDNLHSGGMIAIIDLQTGNLVTNAADHQWNVYEEHPVTGTKIKGFHVPYFETAMRYVREACLKYHMIGYLGWDWAITDDGPVLIEINLSPGSDALTTPYLYEKKGMKQLMMQYL